MADTPMLNKLLEHIAETNPRRLSISAHEYVQLRTEVMVHLSSFNLHEQSIMPPPDGATGFAGYLYGIPLYIEREDKLIKAAQKALEENDGTDRSSDR